jgi:phospholipid/cholesterol/gamma-HCH transport system permease protein
MKWLMDLLAGVGSYTRFCGQAFMALRRADGRETLRQAYDAGVGSLAVILSVCGFAGAMLTVQGFASLAAFGTPEMLGMFVALAGVREVFPLIAAGCVGAKVGSALASEMATLRMGHQLDALEVMAVDPMEKLVAPRLIACVFMTPLLVGAGMMGGLVCSYVIATLQLSVDAGGFLGRALENMAPRDVAAGMTKAVLFGGLTGTLACWHGYGAQGGPQAVGRAANRAVVQAMVAGAVVNLLVSHGFYGGLL